MTASVSAARPKPTPAAPEDPAQAAATNEFELVESSAGWQLTITLTDRLRDALASGGDSDQIRFGVRIAPNLVPGEPFEARLVINDPGAR